MKSTTTLAKKRQAVDAAPERRASSAKILSLAKEVKKAASHKPQATVATDHKSTSPNIGEGERKIERHTVRKPGTKSVDTNKKESEKKWGTEVMALGYCIFPSILLQAQGRLGLSPQQMVVLLQLAEHWWKAEGKVFPSKDTIAERIGLSTKQVQRHVKVLEDLKLVKRNKRFSEGRGQLSNEYDLSGLVAKLKALEPEIAEARKLKAAATKPGGLRAALAKRELDAMVPKK